MVQLVAGTRRDETAKQATKSSNERLIVTSWHIHIEGRVQGVGFRPFIYGLAHEMNICGCQITAVNTILLEQIFQMCTLYIIIIFLQA